MEKTIDRTSYRRSLRLNSNLNENEIKCEEKNNYRKFLFSNMILNQIIVSLLIMVGILTANYFELEKVPSWISKNISGGYSSIELISKINDKIKRNNLVITSGETIFEDIIDNAIVKNEIIDSGEKVNSGELITAVEGINQMDEDIKFIKEKYNFYLPINGTITSRFGNRESDNPIVSSYHTGLDIGATEGTDIHAAHSGVVIMSKNYSSYGKCIMIEDNNLITLYAHCKTLNVEEGQQVDRGDIIARVGKTGNATGPHLHFEIRFEGRFVNPEELLSFN